MRASRRPDLTAVKVVDGPEFVLAGDSAAAEAGNVWRRLELFTALDFVFEPQETEASEDRKAKSIRTDQSGPQVGFNPP